MKTVGKIFDVVEEALKWICIVLTVAFTLITFASVIARYCFRAPFDWSEQTCRYLFFWSVMLYMPVITRQSNNLGFDLLLKKLPKKAQDVISIFCLVLIDAFAAFYCFYSVQFIAKTMAKKLSGINVPYWAVHGAQVVGAGILFLFTLELIINKIVEIAKKGKEGNA